MDVAPQVSPRVHRVPSWGVVAKIRRDGVFSRLNRGWFHEQSFLADVQRSLSIANGKERFRPDPSILFATYRLEAGKDGIVDNRSFDSS